MAQDNNNVPSLMMPGPVNVAPEVLAEMASPMTPHYGPEWTEFHNRTVDLLAGIFGTSGRVRLIPGTGSAALDACLGSTVFPHGRVLVLRNGFFGDRLTEIARSYSDRVEVMDFGVARDIDVRAVADRLASEEFDVLAVVHCETSTGQLNPVGDLGRICAGTDTLFMVDAVSSLGLDPIRMDDRGIDLCASASQKGLGCPAGLGLVAIGPRGAAAISRAKSPGWYLNLANWDRYDDIWGDHHPSPVSLAVNNIRALRASVEAIMAEGLEARGRRHLEAARRCRRGLADLGLNPLLPENRAAVGLTSVWGPEGVDTGEVIARVRDREGIHLAGGLGTELKGRIIRVGHMGQNASAGAVDRAVAAIGRALASHQSEN